MPNWKNVLAFTVFVTLLAAGLILLISRNTSYSQFELLPIPTPRPLVVHITGGVVSPGVYTVPPESRLSDAITAAGGFSLDANREALNLAEMISDGQKIDVPTGAAGSIPVSSSQPAARPALQNDLININTADALLLTTLPGIGETKASDIIAYRNAHGAFQSASELLNVKGIGPANYEKIKDLITIQ